MPTKTRAQRLGEYLERKGWGVYLGEMVCPKCGASDAGPYCRHDGVRMVDDSKDRVHAELDAAIKYALRERS